MANNKKKIVKNLDLSLHLPFIPIRELVIFPSISVTFFVGRKKSLQALDSARENDQLLFVVTQNDGAIDEPSIADLFHHGVVGKVVKVSKLPNGNCKVLFEGLYAAKSLHLDLDQQVAKIEPISVTPSPLEETAPLVSLIKQQFRTSHQRYNHISQAVINGIEDEENILNLCYRLAPIMQLSLESRQKILEISSSKELLNLIYSQLIKEEESFKIEEMMREKISRQISKNQKEYYLNEQMRAIMKELGNDEQKNEQSELEKKINSSGMPKAAMAVAKREFKKLAQMQSASTEVNIVRTYLDWLVSLPWKNATKDNLDLNKVQARLDADHYGLSVVKERIIEYIAQVSKAKKIKGPIICLNGPPGVGKTSLAQSIAKALDRNFVRMSLGGIRDEAEIRGHRRTYIGALPGRIISAMKKSKSVNPVILLDEIDKLASSHLGNPAAALLEALDPEQNHQFVDHYLEVEYDLSKVMFICTSNNSFDIPPALRDRMEVINLVGYSETEKNHIFYRHLWPKELLENQLSKTDISINEAAVKKLISHYTREAGIRDLQRNLAKLMRKVNRDLMTDKDIKSVKLDNRKLTSYLGVPKYRKEQILDRPQIGVVNGLAWTPVGGDILLIEVLLLPGKGKITLTGKLGQVMRESAQAAFSYIQANASLFGIQAEKFKEFDVHIHAPEGAVPKDGPSAGVALATALVSAYTGIAVNNVVAMTGEITLYGRILPIGGLKEKLLAALRSKVRRVFVPLQNKADIQNLEKDVKSDLSKLKISFFEDLYSLICEALVSPPAQFVEPVAQGKNEIIHKQKLQ